MANISNSTNNTIVNGTSGDDSIRNEGENVSINGDSGNDYIINDWMGGNNVSIDSGDGNDYINNSGDNVTINTGNGDDYILNSYYTHGKNMIINAGNGNDTIDIYEGGAYSYIKGEAGNDYFINSADYVTINGDSGNDTVWIFRNSNSLIYTGDGNDSIKVGYEGLDNNGKGITLRGGSGNDTIESDSNYTEIIQYNSGDGNDIINGYSDTDTIQISGSSYTTTTSGTDVIISVGNGSMTLKEAAGKTLNIVTVSGGSGGSAGVSISNSTSNTIISGTDYSDTISNNFGSNVTINANDNDDIICNVFGANNVKINGGDGNDIIYDFGWYSTINAGLGDDVIYSEYLYNHYNIDDIIHTNMIRGYNSEAVYQYANGDGNDTINFIRTSDIIQITSGSYVTQTSGNDVILNIGSGKMTLKDAANTMLQIQNASGTIKTINSNGSAYIKNTKSNKIINGSNNNDTIISTRHNGSSISSDSHNVTINSGNGNDFIDNESSNSVINTGLGNDTTIIRNNNVTLNTSGGNDTIVICRDFNNLINGSNKNDNITIMDIWFYSDGEYSDTEYSKTIKATIKAGNGDDTITGSYGLDTFQYASGDGNDIISGYNENDTIQISGSSYTTTTSGNDVIINVGDGSMTLKDAVGTILNIVTIAGGSSSNTETTTTKLPTGLKYNTDKTQITVGTKFKGDTVDLTEYASTVKTIKATSFNKTLTISGNDLDNTIKVGKKATTVYGGAGNDTITGGKGADVLYGNDGNDKIKGGTGADTLAGGAGNDTLTGGASKDVFIYDGQGSDIITDYKASQKDEIVLTNGTVESVSVKGSNVIFTIGDGQLTVKGGKKQKITITDADGNTTTQKYTKSSSFVEPPDARAVNAGSDYDYWFAIDDNMGDNEVSGLISSSTDSAINLTDLNTDYSTLSQNDKMIYQSSLSGINSKSN